MKIKSFCSDLVKNQKCIKVSKASVLNNATHASLNLASKMSGNT
ncbi:predicted protein [Sclerotinia sclerotiorum 1980 UF-70]|uniref:Uncharacterized protein n=1 Tax=Sclerotinia sclerotiorum (strain ATCC 18683 / 1980 / Ss-1) TaxID=665079 RepID=A7EDG7_SCLS1|nr:predicted protein [Sclerotinia sclerotiorum 1980 UF-70]EDO00883.1 predicted protein [Sclerotinia sclerotiorum 1980 UF-70]